MLKDYVIVFILFIYLILFILWLIWLQKSLKNSVNKKKKYLVNVCGFVVTTYFMSFLVLKILS